MRPLVGLVLAAVVAGCSASSSASPTVVPYPLPSGPPHTWQTVPIALGTRAPAVVLYLTPRPGDRIELLAAEGIGVAAGADVQFFFSRPILEPNGDHMIGERLEDLAGATFSNTTATQGPDSTIGIVAGITAREPGRYQLTGVRLRFRVNGGAEQIADGIDVVFTVCAADPAPASCEDPEHQ